MVSLGSKVTLATFSQAGSEEVGNGAETAKVKISQDVLIYSINPKYNITLDYKFTFLIPQTLLGFALNFCTYAFRTIWCKIARTEHVTHWTMSSHILG